jgi:hypothetical protein
MRHCQNTHAHAYEERFCDVTIISHKLCHPSTSLSILLAILCFRHMLLPPPMLFYRESAPYCPKPLILAKCGYMRTMAYIIVFGPIQFAGSGFVRWLTLQGEGQIMLFLKHWRARDDAGLLLRIALGWVQYQSGRGIPILEDVHSRIPYLESRWNPSLRQFLACPLHARQRLRRLYPT